MSRLPTAPRQVWLYVIWDISDTIGGYLVRGPFYTFEEARGDRRLINKNEWLLGPVVRVSVPMPVVRGARR